MNLNHATATQNVRAQLDNTSPYQTQFEFMSMSERLSRINQRIKNFTGKSPAPPTQPHERCAMLHFSVDGARITDARHLIISLCKDKLIFMRVKPILHSDKMHIELFLNASVVPLVKEMMQVSFQC